MNWLSILLKWISLFLYLRNVIKVGKHENILFVIGPWISSRCFFKDGSSSTPCLEFRMVTHKQGSPCTCVLKFQCMVVHFSVTNVIFLLIRKISNFVPNKVYSWGILLHYFIQNKSAAEAYRILVETYGDNVPSDTTYVGFDASKIMIFNLRIKNVLAHRKNLKTNNWRKYSMRTDLKH